VRDDDVDYTVLGLHLLQTYGPGYTSIDVAREWLFRFPVYQLYTAERAVYQNLIRKVALLRDGWPYPASPSRVALQRISVVTVDTRQRFPPARIWTYLSAAAALAQDSGSGPSLDITIPLDIE